MLSERLKIGTPTTEDSVRFTFFAAMLKEGVNPSHVIIEYPHPNLPRKKIDMWISPKSGSKGVSIEFKYNRGASVNQPRPLQAGKALHDLHRMSQLGPDMHRIFVYLTDTEMASYFNNARNGLSAFFGASVGSKTAIGPSHLQNLSATLRNAADLRTDIQVQTLCNAHLHSDHHLRVWEIV